MEMKTDAHKHSSELQELDVETLSGGSKREPGGASRCSHGVLPVTAHCKTNMAIFAFAFSP